MLLPSNSLELNKQDIIQMIYLVSYWIENKKTHNFVTVFGLYNLALELRESEVE